MGIIINNQKRRGTSYQLFFWLSNMFRSFTFLKIFHLANFDAFIQRAS